MLAPSNIARPAWAVFDVAWYKNRYSSQMPRDCEDQAVLDYYLNVGVKLGHSPSPLFDEGYYLAQNPDIVELIRAEHYHSGFDHFCRHGHRTLSAHWLFDDRLYGRLYEDMSIENLDMHGCAGRYDHYLKSGQFEHRQAHFLFDPAYYHNQAVTAGAVEDEIKTAGPYVHFLYRLSAGQKELAGSVYFDPSWYMRANFGVKAALASGQFGSAVEHYLRNNVPGLCDPVPEFSEAYYCEANPDINYAVAVGDFRCGYQHFVQFGAFELRRPHPQIDLVYYRDMNPCVNDDLNAGLARDAFAHLRIVGVPERLVRGPPEIAVEISEQSTKKLFRAKAELNATLFARQTLDFQANNPVVSVIVVAFNRFELTMLALASLRINLARDIQLILIDNGSSDRTKSIERYVKGAVVVHLAENVGFLRAANIALAYVTAAAVLYLNNDIELGFGALCTALRRLNSDDNIGAIGGKIVRTHGQLQEAGSIIWRDGAADGYMRGESPLSPEANFVRDVDYCSGVFLLCRADVVKNLDGLDPDFSPAYYEDADLCVRIKQSGFRVLYDPAVIVHHLEFGSADTSDASMALMRRGQRIFATKHQSFLGTKFDKLPKNMVKARSTSMRPKLLFIEDTIPLRRLGSGFVRSNDVVKAIILAGYDVSIFPVNGTSQEFLSLLADFPDNVEILYDRNFTNMPAFLTERADYYDLIWVSRTHNLTRLLPLCIEAGIMPDKIPFVLDTEAVVAVREAARNLILADFENFDFQARLSEEFLEAKNCVQVAAVNQIEVDLLRKLGLPAVSILGTIGQTALTPNDFSAREGLLFVASIHQTDSPNLDALHWFRNEILPWLSEEMETPPVLNFVGYVADGVDISAFANDPKIIIHGPVDDLTPYYNNNRVFVAPTRFAAGTPYKIYEAASFGVPCVTTDLLARQLGWRAGVELLSAPVTDARRFAAQIALLYRTETIWTKLRLHAAQRLELENSPEIFNAAVRDILSKARLPAPALPAPVRGKRRAPGKSVPVG